MNDHEGKYYIKLIGLFVTLTMIIFVALKTLLKYFISLEVIYSLKEIWLLGLLTVLPLIISQKNENLKKYVQKCFTLHNSLQHNLE